MFLNIMNHLFKKNPHFNGDFFIFIYNLKIKQLNINLFPSKVTFTLFVLMLFVSCNKKVKKSNKNINDFVISCMGEAQKSYSNELTQKQIKDYCTCAADKAFDEFTTEDLSKLNDLNNNSDIQKRMSKIIEPCIDQINIK